MNKAGHQWISKNLLVYIIVDYGKVKRDAGP